MHITQIEIYKAPVKLEKPFIISLGPLTHAENVVVVIKTNEGLTGFGECSPFMTIHGESMDTCYTVGQYLAKGLLSKNPLDIANCCWAIDAIIYGNSCIKSAFDIALHDIASRHAGLPLYAFLGGKNNKILQTYYTISLDTPEKMAEDAVEIMAAGFKIIKVKFGGKGPEDLKRIKLIREKTGPDFPLRIDANQGWDTETAIATLKALAPYNIQHCEEPIPRWNYMQLPEIRKQSPIPIMADESCCDENDAARLAALEACDYFNVKLGKSSGLCRAMKILKVAEKNNIKMQAGGFLESRLGFTATAHLALASANIIHFDFDTPLMFTEDNVCGGITYGEGGLVTMPEGIGLGAWLEEEYLGGLEGEKILEKL